MTLIHSGELLKTARQKRGLSLADVEKETKIRVKFLRGLEEGDLSIFHSAAYAQGFVRNYGEFLGIDIAFITALFRRETAQQRVKIVPTGLVHNQNSSLFRITPTRVLIVAALIIAGAIGFYFFNQYKGFLGNPSLSVQSPQDQEVVKEGELVVKGSADNDSTVFINSEPVAVGQDGEFVKTVKVFKGETILTITAKNRRGKETTITRKIKIE